MTTVLFPALFLFLLPPHGAAKCSSPGDDCRGTLCCTDPEAVCYRKNSQWGGCLQSCTPGSTNEHDPPQHKTPWACTLLGMTSTTKQGSSTLMPSTTTVSVGLPTTTTVKKPESSLSHKGFDAEVSVGPDVKLHFRRYTSEDIRLAIDVPGTGWAALGVGSSMTDADTVIGGGSKGGGQTADIKSYNIDGFSAAFMKENVATTRLLQQAEVLHEGGRTKVLFTRPLENGVTNITLHHDMRLVWAYGAGNTINYHGANRASFSFNFANATICGVTGRTALIDRKIGHAGLMFLGWGVLIPLGTLATVYGAPRFEAGEPTYFNVHRALQLAGFFSGIIGVVQITRSLHPNILAKPFSTALPTHGYFGLVIMLLASLQSFNVIAHRHKDSQMPAKLEFLHKNMGRLLTLCGLVNCVMGSMLAKLQHKGMTIFTVFLVLSVVSLVISLLVYIVGKYIVGTKNSNFPDDDENLRLVSLNNQDNFMAKQNNVHDPQYFP